MKLILWSALLTTCSMACSTKQSLRLDQLVEAHYTTSLNSSLRYQPLDTEPTLPLRGPSLGP